MVGSSPPRTLFISDMVSTFILVSSKFISFSFMVFCFKFSYSVHVSFSDPALNMFLLFSSEK